MRLFKHLVRTVLYEFLFSRAAGAVVLLLLNLGIKGQADSLSRHGKFDLGVTFSPDYSYRVLDANPSDKWIKENFDSLEVYKISYTVGFNLIFHLRKNIFISAAALIADKGER